MHKKRELQVIAKIGLVLSAILFIISIYANKQPNIREDVRTGPTPVSSPIPEYRKVKVSWYGKEVCQTRVYGVDCKTASGEIYDEEGLTFASRSGSFGDNIKFCYNGSCVVCRRNDFGPAVYTGRDFDLSKSCFESISSLGKGVIEVTYEKI
jgi:rare lipoprotein A (peptidoglycan hydrolase)